MEGGVMLLDFVDQRIRKAFSDAAMEYDVLTSLHKEIGRELIKKALDVENDQMILDIGMGTGWLTSRLKFYFPESRIVGMDFAEGMIHHAQQSYEGFDVVQADAKRLPFKQHTFNLVVSNLALQWLGDLPGAMNQVARCLKPDGSFVFTMFGRETFRELFSALEYACRIKKGTEKVNIQRLFSTQEVEKVLASADFRTGDVDYERIKVRFPDMMGMIQWIRAIGANSLAKDIFLGKELLNHANDFYNQHYKDRFGIYATFEVIWGLARH